MKLAAPFLKRQGGAIIVTSSVNGSRVFSTTGASDYSPPNAAQVAFTTMVAQELDRWKVRERDLSRGRPRHHPGAHGAGVPDAVCISVDYPQTDPPPEGGESGAPEQVAEVVPFFASDAGSHVTGADISGRRTSPAAPSRCPRESARCRGAAGGVAPARPTLRTLALPGTDAGV